MELINSNNKLSWIKCNYILKKLFDIIDPKRALMSIQYNKYIQKRIDKNINNYKNNSEIYSLIEIEIEIIPKKNKFYIPFINIIEENRKYYHIYFNNNKTEEIKKTTFNSKDKVRNITIFIDYQIKSFSNLFYNCNFIKSIDFKKYYRLNITDMSYMFYGCSTLDYLNLTNFKTNRVNNMSYMFYGCSSLDYLNLNNFDTSNTTDMSYMFGNCESLR